MNNFVVHTLILMLSLIKYRERKEIFLPLSSEFVEVGSSQLVSGIWLFKIIFMIWL
jgi:hypothetical protein